MPPVLLSPIPTLNIGTELHEEAWRSGVPVTDRTWPQLARGRSILVLEGRGSGKGMEYRDAEEQNCKELELTWS